MSTESVNNVNFLRGVPADEALTHIIETVSTGYANAINKYGTDVLQYGHFCGLQKLREVLGDIHNVDASRVVAGNGGLEMISFYFKSLPKGSTIIIEESTYDRIAFDTSRYGHQLIGVKLTPEGLDLKDFEETLDKVDAACFYGIPFHHNPTGINYTVENRLAVEEICKKNGIPCVWDICYQPLRYDGTANTPVNITEDGPIVISSFTKTISPGTKCGYMILPEKEIDFMTKIISNTRLNPNLPTQAFVAEMIETGEYEKYLTYLKGLYKPRMDALVEALHKYYPGAYPAEIVGGFFSTITLSKVSIEKEQRFFETAKNAGVNIAPAWSAVAPNLLEDKKKEGVLARITFPANTADQISWGIAKLKEIEESM